MINLTKRIFLCIFMSVSHINVRQWFGSDRKHANYVNGAIAVSIIQVFIAYDIFRAISKISRHDYDPSLEYVISLYVLLLAANYWWLVMKGAGAEFARAFRREPQQLQRELGLAAFGISSVAFVAFFALQL